MVFFAIFLHGGVRSWAQFRDFNSAFPFEAVSTLTANIDPQRPLTSLAYHSDSGRAVAVGGTGAYLFNVAADGLRFADLLHFVTHSFQ